MAMTIRMRALGEKEAEELAGMARSRTLGTGLVRRAQIVPHAAESLSAPGIAARLGLCDATVRYGLERFNERGLGGLAEDMRSGRPPVYSAEERNAVIAAALSRPADLGLPFASWTLDRLVACLGEKGIGMKRSRAGEVPLGEGLKWRQEETWFGARVDPQFERKRGRSSASTLPRPRAPESSASTRWGRSRPGAIPAGAWSSRPVPKRSAPMGIIRNFVRGGAVEPIRPWLK
jgi:transposase